MSGEDEKIKFIQKIDPRDKKVEDWMNEVEQMMFRSIRDCVKFAIEDYLEIPRTEWVLKHPGMCVLNCSQVHWTSKLETYAKEEGIAGVKKFLKILSDELADTVNLVRRKLTNL
jgi:dynein heavy chain